MNSVQESGTFLPVRVEIADTDELFNHVFSIRTEVFVEETSIDQEDEYDGFDHLSTHYLAWYGNNPAGAARRRRLTSGDFRLERFAVLEDYRGKGVGTALVHAALKGLPKGQIVRIHSLLDKVPFYEKFGFKQVGEEFEEAGIAHVRMSMTIDEI